MPRKTSSDHAQADWQQGLRPKTESRPRVLIFIVAYNAEKTIAEVLQRIPSSLNNDYDVEILIIDDASSDATFEQGEAARRSGELPFPLNVLF